MDEKTFVKFQIIAGELSLDFINTLDNRAVPERRLELLPTYTDLVEWAMQAGAISASKRNALLSVAEQHPREADIVRQKAAELRETLYRIVTSTLRNRRPSQEDLRSFNASLGEALSHLELSTARGEFRLGWAGEPLRLDSVLWPIVRSASNLLSGDDLTRVRECGADTCRWLFVDRSKNHSRRWCDMKVCGNRVKARTFYRRQSGRSRARAGTVRNL